MVINMPLDVRSMKTQGKANVLEKILEGKSKNVYAGASSAKRATSERKMREQFGPNS